MHGHEKETCRADRQLQWVRLSAVDMQFEVFDSVDKYEKQKAVSFSQGTAWP